MRLTESFQSIFPTGYSIEKIDDKKHTTHTLVGWQRGGGGGGKKHNKTFAVGNSHLWYMQMSTGIK